MQMLLQTLPIHGTPPVVLSSPAASSSPQLLCSTTSSPTHFRKQYPRKQGKLSHSPSSDPLNLKPLTSRVVQLTRRRQLAQIFDEIEIAKKHHGKLNIIAMNAVMQACVHCRDIESALRVFYEMSRPEGRGVDDVTYGTLLKGLGDARRIDEAFQLLESVEKGTAVGSPQLSAPMICGLLNALTESVQGVSAVLTDFLQDMVMHFNKAEGHQSSPFLEHVTYHEQWMELQNPRHYLALP